MNGWRGAGLREREAYGKGEVMTPRQLSPWRFPPMTAFSGALEDFIDEAPFCVMTRGLLENVFAPGKLDELFERHSQAQYHRQLLFSTAVDVLTEVVLSIRPSVNTA